MSLYALSLPIIPFRLQLAKVDDLLFQQLLQLLRAWVVGAIDKIVALVERISPIGLLAVRVNLLGTLQMRERLLVDFLLSVAVVERSSLRVHAEAEIGEHDGVGAVNLD